MVGNVNTQTDKVLERIQLYDASGPQPLADERNYQFLQELFDKKQKDPLANYGYDVYSVAQSTKTDWKLDAPGYFIGDLKGLDDPTNFRNKEDADRHKAIYDEIIKISPRLSEKNKAVYMHEPWNTPDGIITALHEFRHKAIDDNPKLQELIDKNSKIWDKNTGIGNYEELLNKAMDMKYHDSENAKEYLKNKYKKHGVNLLEQPWVMKFFKDSIEEMENILQEDK